jgi:K+-transporting ATPase ATPase A chain
MGPAASQVAIKQLGTNGGGFFAANSAHPFENPTPLSNFLEMLAILLIPAALCYTYGLMINDKKQGWAILGVMLMIAIPCALLTIFFEQQQNPVVTQAFTHDLLPGGGNMEGKEVRLGIVNSGLWSSVTTASSNGSTNSNLNAYLPLGNMIPLILMHLGEVILGGVGSGLYTMLMFVIIAIFIAGLMVGRTPEYLGKKIEPFEMKMATFAVLVMPLIVLFFTAITVMTQEGQAPGPHGLSQVLYAFSSMTNNNGSAMVNFNTPFYNTLGGIAMLIGRYGLIIPVLAIAGSLAQKKKMAQSLGTLETHSLLFSGLLISVVLLLGALSFFPVLSLGPIIEHLNLWVK